MSHLRSALLPVVAILLVLLAWLAPSGGDEAPRPPGTVAIDRSTYACPAGSVIEVAAGQVAPGTARSATVLPGRQSDPALADATAWQTAVVDGAGVIVRQEGRSSGAVGYFAGTAPASGGGGLVVGSCPGVVDDAWLLGLGSGDKHFSTLILTNLADSTAAVDLSLWGPKGQIDAVNTDGIVIPPTSVRRIRLDSLAAGESELAMRVHRRRGTLSAVANDTSTATFRGTEPVTATQAPSRDQVVGGVVEGTAGRTLLLLNPGAATARVDVRVVGRRSTFTPAGLEQVRVGPGTLRAVTIPRSAGGDVQALRVTSDRPVSTTLRMAPSTKDYAYAEAGAVLDGPTVVPIDLGVGLSAPQLVLSAPDDTASVDIESFDAAMRPLGSTTTEIEAGTTRAVGLSVKGAAYAVLTPRGRVVAATTYVKGDGISSLSLQPAPLTTLAPHVRPLG